MELDAFTSRLGTGQGRVVLEGGEVRFVLGDLDPGHFATLVIGDHVDVTQDLDVTTIALVRAALSLRAPGTLAPTLAWEASVLVDGTKRASLRCPPGRARRTTDLTANVSKLSGVHSIGVRLELVVA